MDDRGDTEDNMIVICLFAENRQKTCLIGKQVTENFKEI